MESADMKIAVIGSGSLAISVVLAAHRTGHEVIGLRARDLDAYGERQIQDAERVINCHGWNPKRKHPELGPVQAQLGHTLLETSWLLQFCARHRIPSLHISTDCVYGKNAVRDPLGGQTQPRPDDVYGFAMALREALVREYGGYVARTSFITPREGLWQHVLARPTMAGWSRVYWNGGLVSDVAVAMVSLAERLTVPSQEPAVWEIAARDTHSKHEIAAYLVRTMDYACEVKRDVFHRGDRVMRYPALVVPSVPEHSREELEACLMDQLAPTEVCPEWRYLWRFSSIFREDRDAGA